MDPSDRALAIAAELGIDSIATTDVVDPHTVVHPHTVVVPAVPASSRVLPGGNQNHVIRVTAGQRDIVVRFAKDAARTGDPFDIEEWCLRAVARAGIPSSPLVARGWHDDVSFLVVDYVEGDRASADDADAWRAVGEFASRLPSIDVADAPEPMFSRFGRDLDAAWRAHLDYNAASLSLDDPLISLGVYERDHRARIESMIGSLRERRLAQGLVHGDLSTRNVVASPDGYTVIDWGAAHVGPTPWSDLEQIRRWGLLEDAESPVDDSAWMNVLAGAGVLAGASAGALAGAGAGASAGTGAGRSAGAGSQESAALPAGATQPASAAPHANAGHSGAAGLGDGSRTGDGEDASVDSMSAVMAGVGTRVRPGPGMHLDEATVVGVLDELAVVTALDVVRWALEMRPDRLDELVARSARVVRAVLSDR